MCSFPWRLEVDALALELKVVVRQKMECWELNVGPQSEPQMLLTTSHPSKPSNNSSAPTVVFITYCDLSFV